MKTLRAAKMKLFLQVFMEIYKNYKITFLSFCLVSVMHGFSWVCSIVANQYLTDSLSYVVLNKFDIWPTYISAFVVCIVTVLSQALNGINVVLYDVLKRKNEGYLLSKIHKKTELLPAIYFETSYNLDMIKKAEQGAISLASFVVSFTNLVAFYAPYFIFLFTYLIKSESSLSLVLVLIIVPIVASCFFKAKMFSKFEDTATPMRRIYDHYEECLCNRKFAKETRVLGASSFFYDKCMKMLKDLSIREWQTEKKTRIIDLLLDIPIVFGYAMIVLILIYNVMNARISIGHMTSIFMSINMMFGLVNRVFKNDIMNYPQMLGAAQKYFSYLELRTEDTKVKNESVNFNGGIVLDNISFKYPDSKSYAIKNVSLRIEHNQTLAIVGENGSGKSTLIKLIAGLYLPTEGSITFGGKDIKNTSKKMLFSKTSAVFQNFIKYDLTLEENVKVSDFSKLDPVNNVLLKANVNVLDKDTFPDGEKTMISKQFGNLDLSLGQWQRIAIARGIYKNFDLLLLDEPTASIDPLEESRVLNMFSEISKNKTTIIVTHRIGAARFADKIIVLDHGSIVEVGSHDELVKNNKKYFQMWKNQADTYE